MTISVSRAMPMTGLILIVLMGLSGMTMAQSGKQLDPDLEAARQHFGSSPAGQPSPAPPTPSRAAPSADAPARMPADRKPAAVTKPASGNEARPQGTKAPASPQPSPSDSGNSIRPDIEAALKGERPLTGDAAAVLARRNLRRIEAATDRALDGYDENALTRRLQKSRAAINTWLSQLPAAPPVTSTPSAPKAPAVPSAPITPDETTGSSAPSSLRESSGPTMPKGGAP